MYHAVTETPETPVGLEPAPRSKQRMLRDNDVHIRFLSIGCVIDIGCKSIPFEDVNEAMKELMEYVNNPEETVKKWLKVLD